MDAPCPRLAETLWQRDTRVPQRVPKAVPRGRPPRKRPRIFRRCRGRSAPHRRRPSAPRFARSWLPGPQRSRPCGGPRRSPADPLQLGEVPQEGPELLLQLGRTLGLGDEMIAAQAVAPGHVFVWFDEVRTATGMLRSRSSPLISCRTSCPPIPGIFRSRSSRSGGDFLTRSTASSPFRALRISTGTSTALSRAISMRSAWSSLSSAKTTCHTDFSVRAITLT